MLRVWVELNREIAGCTLRETRKGLSTCPSMPKPTWTLLFGSRGSCTRLSKFLIGVVFKSNSDNTQCFIWLMTLKLLEWPLTSIVERFLDAQISFIVIFTNHWSVSGLNVPGSESMVFHGIFPCSIENLTVKYSGKDLFSSSSHV